MKATPLAIALLLTCTATTVVQADPQLSSWYTANSSKYARIVETDGELSAGTTKTTWTRTSGPNTTTQALPVYAGPQQIDYSSSWIYVKSPDLGTYVMGPWYNNAARTQLFVNIPKNQAITFRIPRTSTVGAIPTTKTGTQGLNIGGVMQDAVGFFVDGVALFDPMDGFTYANGTESGTPNGQWHRDAYVNEGITFDRSFAHQQNQGKYHNHANPYGLRHQLGDNVTYNTVTKAYVEGNTAAPPGHSPILGWMLDGLPVYGPYGYSTATDANSGVRRMVGGFVLRDGTTAGVDNISTAGRTVPAWSLRNGGSSVAGPTVSTTYPLGRYIEDWAYLGDLIKTGSTKYQQGTDFDLNEYNVRYCVTPEFPNGTYAYFLNITAAGTPQFPYMINRWFYGTPRGGMVTSVSESVTNSFLGGANSPLAIPNTPTVNSGTVSLTWNAVEGGTYSVDASTNQSTWTSKATGIVADDSTESASYTKLGSSGTEYARVNRTALASYDSTGTTAATVAQSTTSSYSAGNAPPAIAIGGLTTRTISVNGSLSGVSLTISDLETSAASLTVTASSSNTTLIPNANITLTGTTGTRTLALTPAADTTGTSTITLTVSDGTATAEATLTVIVEPSITTPFVALVSYVGDPDAEVQFAAVGTTGAVTWTLEGGTFPPGMTLDAATGLLSGAPTASGPHYPVVRVADANSSVSRPFTLLVAAENLSQPSSALPDGLTAVSYSNTLSATGGSPSYTWAITGGTTPPGLTLSTAGVLSGVPTASGTFNPMIRATDSLGRTSTATRTIFIELNPFVIITDPALPYAVKSLAYTRSLAVSGGTGTLAWTLTSGALPSGMTLSSTGVLSGTPKVSGSFAFTIGVTDSGTGLSASQAFTLTVSASYSVPVMHPVSLGTTTVGQSFTYTVSATNYPKTYSVTGLPKGVSYSSTTGVISGRPLVTGVYNVQVKATNPGGTSLTVTSPLIVKALSNSLIGSYTGTIARDATANAGLGGYFTLTVTTTGSYSLRVVKGVASTSATGYIALTAPHVSTTIGGALLSLNFNTANNLVSGTYGAAAVDGWRGIWTTTLNPAEGRAGYYSTELLLASSGDDGVISIPQGKGYTTVTVASAGTTTVAGKTADGQALSTGGLLGPNGEILVYTSLYKNLGTVIGKVTMTEGMDGLFTSNLVSGFLTWSKPKDTSRTYGDGFGPINLLSYGGYLAPTATGNIALGLPDAGTASLSFTDGGLDLASIDPDVPAFTYTSVNTITMPTAGTTANPGKATLAINKNSGIVTGTFTLKDGTLSRVVSFYGMTVRTDPSSVKAVGYFCLPQIPISPQTSATSPILSGGVIISQP